MKPLLVIVLGASLRCRLGRRTSQNNCLWPNACGSLSRTILTSPQRVG
jgi:hypothetical protein